MERSLAPAHRYLSGPIGEPPRTFAAASSFQQSAHVDGRILTLAHEDAGAALDLLYRTYKDRIYTFLVRMTASAELADDLAHDTFIRAHRAMGALDGERRLLPWLYRIASNAAIDELRRRRRFPWLSWLHLGGTRHEEAPDLHAGVPERQKIALALRRVPPESAAALLLHAMEGYSYREIAEIQACSLTAVRSRIARARIAFREAYSITEE